MSDAPSMKAYVCGTVDTKGQELGFLAGCLRHAGVAVCMVDLSTRGHDAAVDVSAAEVAAHHPRGPEAVLGLDDRGAAIAAMATAFERFIATRGDVAGIIGAGGTGGTALVAPGMRALPVGVPKLLVSTVASGNVAAYVGASDITMMPSITDVQGLNRISRRILANAAHALAGMIRFAVAETAAARPAAEAEDRPALGLTMFGVTTACVQRVAAAMEATHDCLVFHAVGTGGRAMEKLIASGLMQGAIDATTTELCDMFMGGIFPADETRFDAVVATRVPYVVSLGALDMVNFGAMDTVPEKYRGRTLYPHNPQVTLMRTTAEECRRMAEFMAAKLNRMEGQVRLLIPEGGVSAIDLPGKPFHDPAADAALFETLLAQVVPTDRRRILRLPCDINAPAFADALVAAYREIG